MRGRLTMSDTKPSEFLKCPECLEYITDGHDSNCSLKPGEEREAMTDTAKRQMIGPRYKIAHDETPWCQARGCVPVEEREAMSETKPKITVSHGAPPGVGPAPWSEPREVMTARESFEKWTAALIRQFD